MLSSKKIVSDSIMMSSQMMLSSACMAYLNDKLIGFKPNKDSYAYQAYQETLTIAPWAF